MKKIMAGIIICTFIAIVLTHSLETTNENTHHYEETFQIGIIQELIDESDCGCNEEETSTVSMGESFNLNEDVIVDNEKILEKIKKAIEENNARWKAGYTSVFKLDALCEIGGLGCIEEDFNDEEGVHLSYDGELPEKYDWSDVDGKDWTTAIRNQKSCGSCVSFGTLGALESVVQIELGQQLECDFSEAHLFFCGGGSCSGGWSISRAVGFLEDYGVSDEECFPYVPRDMSCDNLCPDWEQMAVKVSHGGRVGGFPQNISNVKKALIEYGPLITGFTVYEDFSSYTSGIYEHVYGDVRGGHAITIVGYDDNEECWICKNSWGRNWGEHGYFRIKYGECGIATTMNTFYLSGVYGGICEDYLPATMDNPFPAHNAVNVDGNIDLRWTGGDPNSEDSVTYDIYFGKTSDPLYVTTIGPFSAGQTSIMYSLGTLEKNSRYYWRIVAVDNNGAEREGAIWQFCTIDTIPPEIQIIAPKPGYIYKNGGNFRKSIPPSLGAILIGDMLIELNILENISGIKKADLYIDNRLKTSFYEEPYQWLWSRVSFGRHVLKIVVQDNAGNKAYEEMTVWKFF
jgi:C1A family cysteine protease